MSTPSQSPKPATSRQKPFRPPAVPLVTHNPFFSIWLFADRLCDDVTRHWTGATHPLTSLVRIDGQAYRIIGDQPATLPALDQASLEVLPTRSSFEFRGAGVRLTVTFTSPLLAADLETFARPVTYIAWTVRSEDDREHEVAVYFDAGYELAVDRPEQPVAWSRLKLPGAHVLRFGSHAQTVLARAEDDLRIAWGHLYLATSERPGTSAIITDRSEARDAFARTGSLPEQDDFAEHDVRLRGPRRGQPALAVSFELGRAADKPLSSWLLLAYDELYALEYFERRVRPWWRHPGRGADVLLTEAIRDHEQIVARCREFDERLLADLRAAGGDEYAQLCALVYRQALAAHTLAADADGSLLFLSKETFSNGCLNTVDVIYATAPLLLLVNPRLLRASLEPILIYASSERWPWPFAPHDLGTHPLANGQTYGGGEKSEAEQMPVEECGNMLILLAALAKEEGDPGLAAAHWSTVSLWASYLRDQGLDPVDQLCTDDFAGHLGRNANLSLKAIIALGCYAHLCASAGRGDEAARWRAIAEDYAIRWQALAGKNGPSPLAFGQLATWSQKYNLVWDRLLGLGLFPPEIARQEIELYLSEQNTYGVPLDSRAAHTKLDWLAWTATLAEREDDFRALLRPIWAWANETPARVPLTDWYETTTGEQCTYEIGAGRRGFQARSTVGALFAKALAHKQTC
jgi:hypothetical protein